MQNLQEKKTKLQIISFFVKKYPTTTILLLISFFVEGVLEGVGIISLLALLNIVFGESVNNLSSINEKILELFEFLSINPSLTSILAFITALIFVKALISYCTIRYITSVTADFGEKFRKDLTKNIINANWNFLTSQHSGTYLSLINNNAIYSATIYTHINKFAALIIRSIIFLYFAFHISNQAAFFGLIAGLIIFFILRFTIKMASKNSAIINKKLKIINAKLSDNFKGIKILKTMGKESFLINQFLNDYKILRNSEKGVMLAKHTLIILREPIAVIFLTMLIYFYVVHMQLDFSKVIVISILFYRILTTLNQVQAEYLVINIAQEYFWSMDDILSKSRKAKEITEKKKKLKKFNSLQLKNISFSFGNKDIFKNANFVLKKNNLTLLHGKSGIGKTTLMDIIVGFYKPDNGQMFLNKENFFDYDIKSFRKKIGYVSQDQFLYNETILRNICLDKRIDKNKIEKILIEADCKSFVNKLPKKINTIVGEKGTNLSGGQKQRLSIARALLQNPDLIILDEPTVGLDHKNKEIILRKLKQLSENKTIIIVSHDKYVFKYADFIYNINSQKLVRV